MKLTTLLLASLLALLSPHCNFSQWGISAGILTEKAVIGDIFYTSNNHIFHGGGSFQLSNAKGEEKYSRKSNYGLTTAGDGEEFYTIDFAYGYQFFDTLEVFIEFSVGKKKYYTNYIDNRFTDGGYHLVYDDDMISGIGYGLSFELTPKFQIFASYNSIRKIGIGFRLKFIR